jgi:cation diffusion facilitator CzcD-associated flavoprotein CzcO
VVGLGASGVDIAREISQVAKEVHIASRNNEHRLGKIDLYPNVWMHAEVQNSELSYSLSNLSLSSR